MFRIGFFALVVLAALGLPSPALAQSTVYIPAILSCRARERCLAPISATACCWQLRNQCERRYPRQKRSTMPLLDTQSEAGNPRPQCNRCSQHAVVDHGPLPRSPGSRLALTQQAEIRRLVGGEAAAITQKGNPYAFFVLHSASNLVCRRSPIICATASRRRRLPCCG